MNVAHFGDGTIGLDWTGVEGRPGLLPQLVLKGKLIAKGYSVGAVVQVTADVTASDILGSYAFLGTTTARPYVLNWVRQQFVQPNPPPDDEVAWNVNLCLPMPPFIIEGLEEKRQGQRFSLQLDTTLLLIDRGETQAARPLVHYAINPTMSSQDRIPVSQNDWAQVLERWERGVGIPVLVTLVAPEPNPDRAGVVRHLKDARQKIDGVDYSGSFTESRLALELLRKLSTATLPLPKDSKDRDPLQRIRAIVEALFSMASAPLHTDPPIRDFVPMRADAVALAAATAGIAQQVFAWLDR